MKMRVLILATLVCGAACSSSTTSNTTKKAAGAACTGDKASECSSNICLVDITCNNGKKIPGACAGAECTPGGTTCGTGNSCVPVEGKGYCLPDSLCN